MASPAPRPAPGVGPPLLDQVDYLEPPARGSRAAAPLKVLGTSATTGGERVEYTSMQGNRHLLTRFRGRHVEVLLPDSWMGEGKLTAPLIRSLLDRADLLYEHYRELAGEEPGPVDRRLPIAVVAPTCGFGCGYVGAKGTEVLDDDVALAHVRDALAAGHTPPVVVHEMGHNFDFGNGLTREWGDSAHAWNEFVDRYLPVYSRTGTQDAGPDEALRSAVAATFGRYFADSALTWDSCFNGTRCDDGARNRTWAGTLWRLAELHGAGAVKGYLAFLREARATGAWPLALEEKNDVHVEAMAAGAGLDLGCYADAWRWRATAAVRERMRSRHGEENPFCEDLDGDGASPAAEDCDDSDPGRHPGLAEVADGLDNDCNRRVDDLLAVEPAGGDFAARRAVSYPARLRGRITDGDSDVFTFDLASPRRVRIDLCSRPDFQGWLFVYDRNGGWLGFQGVGRGECSSQAWTLDEAREWVFSVDLNVNSMPGGYEVTISDAEPWPVSPWAGTEARRLCDGALTLSATAPDLPDDAAGPRRVRFWVEGTGWVGAVPSAPWAALRWTPPAGFDAAARTFRAQLLTGEAPASDVTPPAPLAVAGACETPGVRVTPASGLATREGGGTATFSVALTSRPTTAVTIPVSSSDPGEGTVAPASLTFTPADWEAPRVVTVTGVADTETDGDVAYAIVLGPAASTDPAYAGIDPPDVAAVNADAAGSRGSFFTLTPCRVLDTRRPEDGPALATGAGTSFRLHGLCGIPATARAVAANVTVTGASGPGHLTAHPGDQPAPATSTINFQAGQTRANCAIVPLAADGRLAIQPVVAGGGSVHVIVDVSGYFE